MNPDVSTKEYPHGERFACGFWVLADISGAGCLANHLFHSPRCHVSSTALHSHWWLLQLFGIASCFFRIYLLEVVETLHLIVVEFLLLVMNLNILYKIYCV